jgi:sugar transferase (PEP-CTERM system associated)
MIRVFHHYIPVRVLALIAAEATVLMLAIYAGIAIRFSEPEYASAGSLEPLFPKAAMFCLVMILTMTTFGMYQREYRENSGAVVLRLAASLLLGFGVMSLVFYVLPALFLGRGVIGIAMLLAFAGIAATRLLFSKFTDMGMLLPRVLVLGTGSRALNMEALTRANSAAARTNIIGYLPVSDGQHFVAAAKILKVDGPLTAIVEQYNIHEVVIAVRERRGGTLPLEELLQCKLSGVRVTELSTFFERERGQVRLDSVNASWLILGDGFRNNTLRDTTKRAFDLSVSLCLLLLSLPVLLLAALAIKLESPGPVFYRQERVGLSGTPFTIFKLRSMRADAEFDGEPRWAKSDDVRTTRVGRVLRKLRIDELPQILNVVKGEMSFVGPRPERPHFVDQLSVQIPYYATRHSVKPGITGWAQVRYPYGASVEDAVEKLQYDLYYVKNHGLFLDIMILLDTVQVVLWARGAR